MDKYIIRGSLAAVGLFVNLIAIPYNWPSGLFIVLAAIGAGFTLFEFMICLICYHHALWNQDQTEQKLQDGTK